MEEENQERQLELASASQVRGKRRIPLCVSVCAELRRILSYATRKQCLGGTYYTVNSVITESSRTNRTLSVWTCVLLDAVVLLVR